MASNFTPGPWVCYADTPSVEPNWHIVTSANRQRVIANVHIEPGVAMDEANAKLITAAPEMLEALQLFERYEQEMESGDHIDGMITYAQLRDAARAAIAKATGEQP